MRYYVITYPNNGAYGRELYSSNSLTDAKVKAKAHTLETGNETEVCDSGTHIVLYLYQSK